MPKIDVLDINGKVVEQMEISEDLFAAQVNEHCVYEVVKNHLANKRQGTQSAKTRAEVRGGGRKPWRQKGTVEQDNEAQDIHNGSVVELYLHQNLEITAIK